MGNVEVNSKKWFHIPIIDGEIWKSVIGYDGLYEISNKGRIRSLDRYVKQQGRLQLYKGQNLTPFKNNTGYFCIRLSKDNVKKSFTIHRLVATAFLPNPNNLPCINHKDESKNNNVENLEWCTHSYNMSYGTLPARKRIQNGHKICMYDRQGKFIRLFDSAREIEELYGIDHSKVLKCCYGDYHIVRNHIFRFFEETKAKNINVTYARNTKRLVYQYDSMNNLVAIYNSVREAERKTNIKHEYISACCRGLQKSANGYIWKYQN